MEILEYSYEQEGLKRVYENKNWTVGIKNWKPANDIAAVNCLERHNKTDELFVLLEGSCTLLYANEKDGKLEISKKKMELNRVYSIPSGLWHNTVMTKNTKMILIEASDTSMDNSDIIELTPKQIEDVKTMC